MRQGEAESIATSRILLSMITGSLAAYAVLWLFVNLLVVVIERYHFGRSMTTTLFRLPFLIVEPNGHGGYDVSIGGGWAAIIAIGTALWFAGQELRRFQLNAPPTPYGKPKVFLAAVLVSIIVMLLMLSIFMEIHHVIYGDYAYIGKRSFRFFATLAVILVGVTLLHEASHVLVFRLYGVPARLQVSFWPRLLVGVDWSGNKLRREPLMLAVLAPLILGTILCYVYLHVPWAASWAVWAAAINASGAVADILMFLWLRTLPKGTMVLNQGKLLVIIRNDCPKEVHRLATKPTSARS